MIFPETLKLMFPVVCMFSKKKYCKAMLLSSCCVYFTYGCLGNGSANNNLPEVFPCQWTNGKIPYVFDFYAITSTRIFNGIRKGHEFIQNQSCLTFEEHNPITMAQGNEDDYYLYYTFSNALDTCCSASIEPDAGRRIVLLTPGCKEPHEVAHVILHMLGLTHKANQPFSPQSAAALLRPENCSYTSLVTNENSTTSQEY